MAPGDERDFLDPLPIGLIWGVGPTTERRLHEAGISTRSGNWPRPAARSWATCSARRPETKLAALSANVDERAVETPARSKSMGAQAALGRRDATPELIRETLGYLADRVAGRLRKANLAGRTVTVRVRFPHMRSVTRSVTLSVAISTTLTLTEVAERLARSAILDNEREREITLLAVSVSNLRPEHSLQLELPLDSSGLGREVRAPDLGPSSKPPDGEWTGPSTRSGTSSAGPPLATPLSPFPPPNGFRKSSANWPSEDQPRATPNPATYSAYRIRFSDSCLGRRDVPGVTPGCDRCLPAESDRPVPLTAPAPTMGRELLLWLHAPLFFPVL